MEEHETPGSGLSMQGYVQTFSKLGRTFLSSVFSTVGSELLHTVPHCEFLGWGVSLFGWKLCNNLLASLFWR